MTALDIPLSTAEEAQLAECEETIGKGLQTFVDVGLALAKIRDGRLYRQTHTTFEAYCEQEWQLTRQRVYQMIDAATVTDSMSNMLDTPTPANPRQAAELSGLEPEVAADVMRKASESGEKVTAKSIAEAREEVAPKSSRFTKVRSEAIVDKETGEVIDANSAPAPEHREDASPSVDDVLDLDNDDEYRRLDFCARLSADITRAHRAVLTYDAAEVGRLAEASLLDSLSDLGRSFTEFAQQARAAAPRRLRAVDGGN